MKLLDDNLKPGDYILWHYGVSGLRPSFGRVEDNRKVRSSRPFDTRLRGLDSWAAHEGQLITDVVYVHAGDPEYDECRAIELTLRMLDEGSEELDPLLHALADKVIERLTDA